MKKTLAILMGVVLAAVLIGAVSWPGRSDTHADASREAALVTTTNVLSSLVEEISAGSVGTMTLIPSGNCPGQFDLKPSHLKAISDSGVIFAHGFESYMANIEASLSVSDLTVYEFPIEGSWMIPRVQLALGRRIADAMSEVYPAKREVFEANYARFEEGGRQLDRELRQRSANAGLVDVPVICNEHLADQLRYLGMVPVATYGQAEQLRTSVVRRLNEIGEAEGVGLVVDNLQAGATTGKALARDLGVPHVTISNFPDGLPRTPTLAASVRVNLDTLIATYKHSGDDKNN